MSSLLCNIYRSSKKEGMYLFTRKTDELSCVPEQLMSVFGRPQFSMSILLAAGKKLAKAEAADVIHAVESKGYFLQMPPAVDKEMRELADKNSKLGRL